MKSYVFPGQGSQYEGMGKDLYQSNVRAKELFDQADEVLGFGISKIMFEGSADELKQTRVTQPAVFLHSVATVLCLDNFAPDMVAGHSLGEFSALVASGALSFADGLRLVSARAMAMQRACEASPSTMAAVMGIDDATIERICSEVCREDYVVVPANYNCPGQVVVSGHVEAVKEACIKLKEAGAKRALPLVVGGAFHSPLMEPARMELAKAIELAPVSRPICPIYQNVDAMPHTDPAEIKANLLRQLTSPVRWTQSVFQMLHDGMTEFEECGPGTVLTGLIGKIQKAAC